MKFGALLRAAAAEMPTAEVQKLYTCYKHLKKRLKQLPQPAHGQGGHHATAAPWRDGHGVEQERRFVEEVDQEVVMFNESFIEKEEDNVIRMRSLEDAAHAADTSGKLAAVYKVLNVLCTFAPWAIVLQELVPHLRTVITNLTRCPRKQDFVNFHGEILLLVHWSILAYTSVVKILKKHHKRTRLLVSAPHLDNLLAQPFCSVEVISEIIRKAEQTIDLLVSQLRNRSDSSATAALNRTSQSTPQSLGSLSKSILNAAQQSISANSHVDSTSSEESMDPKDAPAVPAAAPPNGTAAPSVGAPTGALPCPPSEKRRHWQRTDSITSRLQVPGAPQTPASSVQNQPVQAGGAPPTPTTVATCSAPCCAVSAGVGLGEGGVTHAALTPGTSAPSQGTLGAPVAGTGSSADGARTSAEEPIAEGAAGGAPEMLGADRVAFTGRCQAVGDGGSVAASEPSPVPVAGQAEGGAAPAAPAPCAMLEQLPSLLRQTAAALGLWEQIYETASTPSTVLCPRDSRKRARAASSLSTDQSFA